MLTRRVNQVLYCLVIALVVLCVLVGKVAMFNRRVLWERMSSVR